MLKTRSGLLLGSFSFTFQLPARSLATKIFYKCKIHLLTELRLENGFIVQVLGNIKNDFIFTFQLSSSGANVINFFSTGTNKLECLS
jgi:hypothetical protein